MGWMDKHETRMPLLAVLASYVTGTVLDTMAMPSHDVLTWTVIGTFSATVTAAGWGVRGWVLAYLIGVCSSASWWLWWVTGHGAFSHGALVRLLVPATLFGPLYGLIRRRLTRQKALAAARLDYQAATEFGRRWEQMLAGLGLPGCKYVKNEGHRAGYSVTMHLPSHGKITFVTIRSKLRELETAHGGLREGAIKIERGSVTEEVVFQISTKDVLSETILIPADHSIRSISQPISLGLFEDGRECFVTLREIAGLIAGLRGSGKSNLMNVLIKQITQCNDVVVWAIDLKGGRFVRPWLAPWLNGVPGCDKPLFDWVAITKAEADRMFQAAHRGIQGRAVSGDGEKLIPTANQPAVLIIVDEAAVLLGHNRTETVGIDDEQPLLSNSRRAELVTMLVQLGRSEAIDPILATQRGTVTMVGGGDLKSQCLLRIALGTATEADARHVIPDGIKIRTTDLPEGSGYVHYGKWKSAFPVKFYRVEPEMIAAIVTAQTHRRPDLDRRTADAMGQDYATRWTDPKRTAWLTRGAVPRGGGQVIPVAPTTAPPGSYRDRFGLPSSSIVSLSGVDRQDAAYRRQREEARKAEDDRRFNEIVSGLPDFEITMTGTGTVNKTGSARQVMLEIIDRAGPNGTRFAEIFDALSEAGHTLSEQYLRNLLSEEVEKRTIQRPIKGLFITRKDTRNDG